MTLVGKRRPEPAQSREELAERLRGKGLVDASPEYLAECFRLTSGRLPLYFGEALGARHEVRGTE